MMKKSKKAFKHILLSLSILICVLFLAVFLCVFVIFNKYKLNIEHLTSLNNGINVFSASGNDNTLYNTNRSIVQIETLPTYVVNAFVDTEDKRFYSHNGFDVKRIIKSAWVNFTSKSKSQGASTISQQLIKNALLSNEKTYARKLEEIVLAIKMEKSFSKEDILEMYLNTIYFGSNAYGIENASKTYFNKSAKDLTLNEACCLAGLIKSPQKYSPKINYENAIKRKNLVANNMLKCGNISNQEYLDVCSMPIVISEKQINDNSYEEEAIWEACRLLNVSERELINKKYQIVTFKDDELQKEVVKINNEEIRKSELKTEKSLDSLSILTNNKGHVLAYYSNSNYNLHNLTRQPASTLKPFAVYLPCFEHNILSPASAILDEEINYNGFKPNNADKQFHGYVSCREALSNSLNIPAVKALDYLGVKKSKDMLNKLGINITNSDLNLTLALGAVKNGVRIFDLVSAYITLANQGEYAPICFVKEILNENGNKIYSHEDFTIRVASSESCFLVNDILKDSVNKGTAKRISSLNLPIASKTGTASKGKDNTDLYNITYSTQHTLLTWVADINDKILPSSLLSSTLPTEINKQICKFIYSNQALLDFKVPENIVRQPYDLIEYETNHTLIQPNGLPDRYIAYDYFKVDNLPKIATRNNSVDLKVSIDKAGATIGFNAKKFNIYNVYKKTNNSLYLFKKISDQANYVTFKDTNVFLYDNVEYFITNENDELLSEIIDIRPKDFLITLFNNQLVYNNRKWLV